MKRILYTALACAVFLAMLTGTSKKRPPREAGSIPKLAIPPTEGWQRHDVAGIRFVVPPGAKVGRADTLAGVRIELPGAATIAFETGAIDIATRKAGWPADFLMFDAPDAAIVLLESNGGDRCQVVACSGVPIFGAPLCIDAGWFGTHDGCAQVVAIVRSIAPL